MPRKKIVNKEPVIENESVKSESKAVSLDEAVVLIEKEEQVRLAEQKVRDNLEARQVAETELRRYVRRDGGFRAGISNYDKNRAEFLMKKLGRIEPKWDETLNLMQKPDLTS